MINELGSAYYERAKAERGDPAGQKQFLRKAVEQFQKTLALDPENVTAHYNLERLYMQMGDEGRAAYHRKEHEKYLPDYNATDRAIAIARRANPAADHAAQATVIYPLQRRDAFGLSSSTENANQ